VRVSHVWEEMGELVVWLVKFAWISEEEGERRSRGNRARRSS